MWEGGLLTLLGALFGFVFSFLLLMAQRKLEKKDAEQKTLINMRAELAYNKWIMESDDVFSFLETSAWEQLKTSGFATDIQLEDWSELASLYRFIYLINEIKRGFREGSYVEKDDKQKVKSKEAEFLVKFEKLMPFFDRRKIEFMAVCEFCKKVKNDVSAVEFADKKIIVACKKCIREKIEKAKRER